MPTQLPIPNGVEASYSPDGDYIAYTPLARPLRQWKHYRGGTHSRIWIYTLQGPRRRADPAAQGPLQRPRPATGSASTVYFRSDRDGEYNLFAYDTEQQGLSSSSPSHDDFPVVDIGSGGGKLILRAGRLPAPDATPATTATREAAEDRRRDRPGRGPAAVRQGGEVRPQRRRVAVGRAGGVRVPRRDRHGARPRRATRAT